MRGESNTIGKRTINRWTTIKAIDGKSTPKAENETITLEDSRVSSQKEIANYFNPQFTTSSLGRHTSSLETRLVPREIKRKPLPSTVTFTTDQVTKGISSCSNTRTFGPDELSILHIKHLGHRAIEYLTEFFNDSVTSCQIPSIWKSSIVIPIPKSGNDSSHSNLISLSRSFVQQRKFWRLSYFPPSTTTCFHPQTNTGSDFCFATTHE